MWLRWVVVIRPVRLTGDLDEKDSNLAIADLHNTFTAVQVFTPEEATEDTSNFQVVN